MANIKLTNLAKNFRDKTPQTPEELTDYEKSVSTLYKDLKFDLTDINISGILNDNAINSKLSIKDLETSINEAAIMNSLRNWFRTTEYSRLLNPELSIDLRKYLFESLDRYTAHFLGMELMQIIPAYEPRVNIEDCIITIDKFNDSFIIELILSIPSLNNKIINIKEVLSASGYTTL